jgi:RHS repeat-associated protein
MVRERGRNSGRFIGITWSAGLLLAGCAGAKPESLPQPKTDSAAAPSSAESLTARAVLSALRERYGGQLPPALTDGFDRVPGGVRARFAAKPAAAVRFPELSLERVQLDDVRSDMGVDIALRDTLIVDAEAAQGYVVYPRAHASGATVLHRALPEGLEDYLAFDSAPVAPSVSYKLSLRSGVSGLRLIAGALEMLDASGTPRLRVAPPYIVGADGERTDAVLAVEGCRFDTSGTPPWGRKVTPPGATSCTVRVSWSNDDVAYPALLDPRWTTTSTSMVASRTDHTTTLLADGRVLVVGGRTSNTSTSGVSTAEIFNPSGGGTWAGTNSMTGARYMHSATLLPTSSNTSTSGRVLIAGGVTGTATVNTSQLWNPANGQWGSGPTLDAARHGHTATLMPNGNVLVTGGMNLASGTTTVLNTAAIYTNPATGSSTGSWAATGNMAAARRFHTATLLTTNSQNNSNFNNMILVAGGNTGGTTSTTGAQLFNTSNSTWSNTTALGTARESHTATRLANGNVLITGGRTNNGAPVSTTAVFTIPPTGTSASWPASGNMQAARIAHTTTLLGTALATTGAVLAAGGSTNGTAGINTAELWNGSTWSLVSTNLPSAVQAHTATLLGNGTVLVAGGNSGTNAVNTARIFDPSLGVTCTTTGQCLSGFCVGGVCCDTSCANQCTACNLPGLVGTCSPKSNGTTCSDSNACTSGETCQGGNCGSGSVVTCAGADQCHTVAACVPASGCPQPVQKSDGAVCDDSNAATETDVCRSGTCTGTGDPAVVNSFDALGRWSIGQGATATIVGLNANHTQGSKSLEVAGQNYIPINSIRMASLGSVGPLALLDIMLPTQQGNPFWFGSVQLLVSAPSVGINNAFLGQVELTGFPLATWQTLGFQLTDDQVTRLSGSYTDLTFTVALNVPFNETGHYLFDNLRFSADVIPTVQGIAKDSAGATKAIFTYTTAATSVSISYGPANSLSDQNGFIHAPLELPPQQFVAAAHPPFVATLAGTQLSWRVGSHSATATQSSTQLPTETGSDGRKNAVLPDGTRVTLDVVDPAIAAAIVSSDTSYTSGDALNDKGNPNPIGPTSAGTVPGTFKVADDGAAQYVIPLDLPRGRNGVEPHLALLYSSRVGSGIMGPGWALQGLHRITRCKRTYGMGLERGKPPAPVSYSSDDELCMDGEHLVAVAPGEYRTKRDQQSKILVTSTDLHGPATFVVYRKDGTIESYGDGSGQSKATRLGNITIEPAGSVGFSPVTREWLMSKLVDRYGNTMTATYDFPMVRVANISVNGPGVPKTLSYTSNPSTGRAATKTVTFVYTNVPAMAVPKFESGVFVGGGGQLLTEINVTAPNPVAPTLVTKYKLGYRGSSLTARSLLERVQRCGGDGKCMAPTLFGWEPGSFTFRPVVSDVNDFHPATRNFNSEALRREGATRFLVAGDVDGDGRQDLLYRTFVDPNRTDAAAVLATASVVRFGGPNGFGAAHAGVPTLTSPDCCFVDSNAWLAPILIDFTGDGRADVISSYLFNNTQVGKVKRYDMMRTNIGAAGDLSFTPLPLGISTDGWFDPTQNIEEGNDLQHDGAIVLADVNGDGLVDVGRQRLHGTDPAADLRIRPNQNGRFGQYTPVSGNALWTLSTFAIFQAVEQFAADLDGDGRTEIVMQQTDGVHSFGVNGSDANGSTTYDKIATNVPYTIPTGKKMLLDVNGDGLRDVMFTHSVWLNTGNGFLPIPGLDNTALLDGLVDDVDGDGMDDIVVPGCSATAGGPDAQVYLSGGSGNFTPVTLRTPGGFVPSGLKIDQACPHVMMDVDGDGQRDLVQPEMASDNLHIYFRDTPRPDRLTTVHNGLKSTVSIEYSRYDGSANDPCTYPQACGARNVEVVAAYSVDEGQVLPGQAVDTRYTMQYSGATADAQGGGWVGFATVQRTNERTHATDKRYFTLATRIGSWRPFVGLPTLEEVTVPLSETGKTLKRQRTTLYKLIRSNPSDQFGPYSVQPESIDEVELGTRWTQQTFTYDDFGNVLTHETDQKIEGSKEFVEYGVSNDTAKWLLGKVNSITTTSTSAASEVDQRVTTFDIDGNTGAVIGRTIEPGDPQEQIVTTYVRNGDGLVTASTDTPVSGAPRTNATSYDAIEGTWPATITNPLGQVTRVSYHCGLGVLALTVDPNGVKTQRQYDFFGRARSTFDDQGHVLALHYDRPDVPEDLRSAGLIMTWQDVLGRTGRVLTDDLGREIKRSEMAFDVTRQVTVTRAYDAVSGKVGLVSRPFGATGGNADANAVWRFRYDEIGRLTSVAPPNESARTTVYEGLKRTESVGGIVKGYTIEDQMGRVVLSTNIEPSSTAPNQEIQTSFDYGPFGTLRHVRPPGGGIVTLSYDHRGRRTQIIDPDAGTRTLHLNVFGEVVREESPGQQDVVYDLDLLGRPVNVTSGDGNDAFLWDTAVNGIGKLAFEQSAAGVSTAYTYRSNGLPQSTTWTVDGTAFAFDWTYSPSALLTGITYPDLGAGSRFQVTFGYGGDGRIGSLFAAANTFLWGKTGTSDDGQVNAEAFGDGLASIRDADSVTGRLLHLATGSGAVIPNPIGSGRSFANAIQSLGYQYFPDGKLQGRRDDLLATGETFAYDNVDRVTSWQVPSSGLAVQYVYDDAGNVKSRTQSDSGGTVNELYGYGGNGAGPHALTSGPTGTYAYDASGRQTARPGQPVLSYSRFDLPNRIQRTDGTTVSFGYDADGARIVKRSGANQVITLGGLYERRVESAGTTHVFFLPGDGRTVGQIACDSNGTCSPPTFFHPDRLGTIDTVTRQGAVVGREKRDPFGRAYSPASMSGPDGSVTIGFIGQGEDVETGLVNLNRRLYDARLGRFISPDPLVKSPFTGQDYNRYAYAGNNPLSLVDPSGLQTEPPPTDDTDFDIDVIPADDVLRIVAGPTPDDDGVTVRWTTYDGPPSGVGTPTAAWDSIRFVETPATLPAFNGLSSPSQDFFNQGPGESITLLTAGSDLGNNQSGYRDWLTGRRGVFSIPIFGFGSMSGFRGFGSSLLSGAARAALRLRVMTALGGTVAVKLEGQVALTYEDELVAFQKQIFDAAGRTLGDIDVELENAIIEVTTGGGDKFGQMLKYLTPAFNPLSKPVILFAPNITNPGRIEAFKNAGFEIARSMVELDFLLHPENWD